MISIEQQVANLRSEVRNRQLIINVCNDAQRTLLVKELTGQMSDGHWENATPHGHYKNWCRATVYVNPGNLGINFYPERSYNFSSKDLLDCVGLHMCVKVRLMKKFGLENVHLLEGVFGLDGKFVGPPTYKDHGTSTYWADKRKALATFDLAAVKVVGEDEALYSMRDLRRDLNDLKAIVKNQIK